MALTADQWLDRLTYKMDLRAPRVRNLRRYIDGNAPLPEGVKGQEEAWAAFQKKARTNFGELIVEAVTERMIVSGFTVKAPEALDGTDATAPAPIDADDDHCRAIWKRNRLAIGITDVLRDMIGVSAGYMIVGQDAKGKAVITCERPEQVITEQDAQYPIETIAGVKVFRDYVNGYDMAFLHLPGWVHTYIRPFPTSPESQQIPMLYVRGGWRWQESNETGLDFVPVFPYLNRGDIGEFESHTDILDRITWGILQRLVITAMQAYRQRALTGGTLPEEDAKGKTIDYKKVFPPGAGMLWSLPEGIDIWESQQTDFSPILNATKDDIRDLAAVTRTPVPMLIPDAANQSAEGARASEKGLIFKTTERITRASAVLARVLEAAIAIENGDSTLDGSVEVLWEDPERQSLTERADAAVKLNGIVPWRTVMTDVLGFPADRVDKMESERMSDSLKEWIMNPPPTVVRESLTAPIAAPTADAPAGAPTVTETKKPVPTAPVNNANNKA